MASRRSRRSRRSRLLRSSNTHSFSISNSNSSAHLNLPFSILNSSNLYDSDGYQVTTTIQQKRDNITLQQWLHINHFIKSMDDKSDLILSKSINNIINAFGGIKKVVQCLIKNCNQTQLKSITDIIKKDKTKYDEHQKLNHVDKKLKTYTTPKKQIDVNFDHKICLMVCIAFIFLF